MRPPHECGGKPATAARARHVLIRFNEAPARMRGKTAEELALREHNRRASMRPPHECGGKQRGIAPATAHLGASMRPPHECGGKLARPSFGDVPVVASMRPPHECGGKPAARRRRARRCSGFNEAPARMRGKTRLLRVPQTRRQGASMRPPHECGGKRQPSRRLRW